MATNEYGELLNKNGYAPSVFPMDECYYANEKYSACGGCTDLVFHEVFHGDKGGATREQSKRYGAWVTLCPTHHGFVHNYPQFNKGLQRDAQRRVMERYGWDVDTFRKRFGKSYI